jgi:hypothetical protein
MAVIRDDHQTVELDRSMFARAGVGAGAFLGIVVGGTIWTHDMSDSGHLIAALVVLAFCMLVGGVIGTIVANLETDHVE